MEDRAFAFIFKSSNVNVGSNNIQDNVDAPGIFFGDNNTNLRITSNIIERGFLGVRANAFGLTPSTNVTIASNVIRNSESSAVGHGISVAPNSLTNSAIRGNIANANAGDGIRIDAGGNGGNTIIANAALATACSTAATAPPAPAPTARPTPGSATSVRTRLLPASATDLAVTVGKADSGACKYDALSTTHGQLRGPHVGQGSSTFTSSRQPRRSEGRAFVQRDPLENRRGSDVTAGSNPTTPAVALIAARCVSGARVWPYSANAAAEGSGDEPGECCCGQGEDGGEGGGGAHQSGGVGGAAPRPAVSSGRRVSDREDCLVARSSRGRSRIQCCCRRRTRAVPGSWRSGSSVPVDQPISKSVSKAS